MPQRTAEPWTTGSRTAGPQGQAVSRLDRSVMPTAECPDDSYRREGITAEAEGARYRFVRAGAQSPNISPNIGDGGGVLPGPCPS